jgi:hypothetical protein
MSCRCRAALAVKGKGRTGLALDRLVAGYKINNSKRHALPRPASTAPPAIRLLYAASAQPLPCPTSWQISLANPAPLWKVRFRERLLKGCSASEETAIKNALNEGCQVVRGARTWPLSGDDDDIAAEAYSMKAEMFRALMWGAALGCLGFMVVVLGFWISQFIPRLTVADSMMLMRSAMLSSTDPLPPGQAEHILSATHWYREVAVPALVGIFLGAIVGLIRRPTPFEALVAGVSFAVLSRLLGGSMSPASWIGVACFSVLPARSRDHGPRHCFHPGNK